MKFDRNWSVNVNVSAASKQKHNINNKKRINHTGQKASITGLLELDVRNKKRYLIPINYKACKHCWRCCLPAGGGIPCVCVCSTLADFMAVFTRRRRWWQKQKNSKRKFNTSSWEYSTVVLHTWKQTLTHILSLQSTFLSDCNKECHHFCNSP